MGKILVAEDDPMLRFIVSESLHDDDLKVVESATGHKALACLQAISDISLVFSDFNMPGSLDGLRLAQAVKTNFPTIKVILTLDRPQMVGDIAFVPKPYVLADLLNTIRAAL